MKYKVEIEEVLRRTVEMEAPRTSNPINVNLLKNRPTIGMLFMSKYGVDLLKANLISPSYLSAERISAN